MRIPILVVSLAVAAVWGQEDCASQLAGMPECMHKNMADKHQEMKAAVQKCFDDLGCELPSPPDDAKFAAFHDCKKQAFEAQVKPKLEECVRENELLSSFSLPPPPDKDDLDELDRFMFMMKRKMGHGPRRGGKRGRGSKSSGSKSSGSKSSGSKSSESKQNPLDQCEGLKDCLEKSRPPKPDGPPDFKAMKEKFDQMEKQCFEELGVSEACQEIDMKQVLCDCGTQVAEENKEALVDALADCLEANGETDVDLERLQDKAFGFARMFCQRGPGGHKGPGRCPPPPPGAGGRRKFHH